MTDQLKGSDRVSIEKNVHELYKELSDKSGQSPETAPFLLMKDVFMWAVALGVQKGKRRPLEGGKELIFRWDQFSQDIDIPALKTIALVETGSPEILLQEDQILRIAEEFANEGIREIKTSIVDQPGAPLWNLVDLIR
jgi:dnd system-associated protein 4